MNDRAYRIKRVILSPAVSVLIAACACAALLSADRAGVPALIAVCVMMVYNVKARILYKGANYPFAAMFMVLSTVFGATLTGSLTALYVAGSLTVLYFLYQRREQTKVIFLIFLVCGLGALWSRSYLLIAAAMVVVTILMRAMSLRGFVAALLGFITPLIILGGFWLIDIFTLIETYLQPFYFGFDIHQLFISTVALLFGIVMFLPSYGYPAKQRARNMAMLGLTACSVVLPIIDHANALDYAGIINICGAYNIAHFAATRRFGWIGGLLVIIGALLV
ncbi:MAG: hypothetical protein NC301_06300 [Bacteroides sp.]|nr:hypothetical protein [Bacteroides sp.]MCM1378896.1 hypothetical protein [Bacteroides sp.]MCM1445512.1 hypothetical protein [Prevotella sp.]